MGEEVAGGDHGEALLFGFECAIQFIIEDMNLDYRTIVLISDRADIVDWFHSKEKASWELRFLRNKTKNLQQNFNEVKLIHKHTKEFIYKASIPEIQSKFQSQGTTEDTLNTTFQANSESKLKFSATNLEVLDRAFNDSRSIPVRIGAEDDIVAKGKVEDGDLVVARAEMVNRPPPKPPHLQSQGGVFDGVEDVTVVREEQTFAKAWVAGVAAEENGQDLCRVRDANEAGHSAEVGASAGGMWTTTTMEYDTTKMRGSGCAGIVDGIVAVRKGNAPFCRRLQLTARPPLLLAAIFPWNRVRRFNIEKKLDEGTVKDANWAMGNTFDGGAGGVVLSDV
ncbi:hypothetical protein PIB30_026716 [Stylosanthes scabra]|uniref:RNase H type-1 domain-containing protein n=1 Tax=Stylosanthes scabra TaxID=79078 RepID=A0ABU6TAN0_9FABA|nr:hypothetical protein [Stylosanthes scabra]